MASSLRDVYVALYKEAADKAFDCPEWFFDNILHFKLLPWQLKAINVVFDVRRKTLGIPTKYNHKGIPRLSIRSCHGPGKTQFLAALMHIWNFVLYGKIACTAPKEAQLLQRLMPRYRKCMDNAEPSYKENIDVLGREIKIMGEDDWGAIMETASDPDNLSGYHDTPQLFLVDEASARRLDAMFPTIEGALTTPGSVVVEIGNPTRIEGEFHSHHTKKGIKELYYLMHIKHTDAPQLISKEWVDSMRKKYGAKSPVFLIRVLGEFAAYDSLILLPPEFIDEAMDVDYQPDGSHPILKVSIDVADGGADATTVTAALHYAAHVHVLKQKQFYFDPSIAVVKAAEAGIAMFEGFNGVKTQDMFIVDAIGVGAGTAGTLMKAGYNVVRNVGGESSDDPGKWRNRRVQNYIATHDALMESSLTIAPDAIDDEEEFYAHLLSIKRNPGAEKVDDIEPKAKIKQQGLPSPDRADSLAMQYNGKTPTADLVITPPMIIGTMESARYDASIT